MSGRPLSSTGPEDRHTGSYLLSGLSARDRVPPAPRRIARRRFLITLTKWVLPVTAMALLASIALWPEIQDADDPIPPADEPCVRRGGRRQAALRPL